MLPTESRRYVVSGSRSGIGRATTLLLRSQGHHVTGIDVGDCEITADLSTPAGRRHALDAVQARHSDAIDAVILCAGIAAHLDGGKIIAVNYFGAVELAAGLRSLLARGRDPRAVIVVSSAVLVPRDHAVVAACLDHDEKLACALAAKSPHAYASSKLALAQWIRRQAARPDWAGCGILLNGISPGVTLTPMIERWVDDTNGRAMLDKAAPSALAGDGSAEDVALLLAFLASPDNRRMVGQIPFCDGGADVLLRPEPIF